MYNELAQECEKLGLDIFQEDCLTQLIVPEKMVFVPGRNKTLPLATLKEYTAIKTAIFNNELYVTPTIIGISDEDFAMPEVQQNDYGHQFITIGKEWGNFKFKSEHGTCTYNALKSWRNKPVTVFVYGNGKWQVQKVDDTTVRGINAEFFIEQLKFRTNPNEIENMYSHVTVSFNDNKTNGYVKADYDATLLNGLTPVEIEVISSTATDVVVSVKAPCYGVVTGLEVADFEILDNAGVPVTITGVSFANDQYTLSATLSGTNTVNLAQVVDQDPNYFKPLATGVEFTDI